MKKYLNKFKKAVKKLSEDRGLFLIYLLMFFITVFNVIYALTTVKPSDLQLVSHYTAFGTTHLYRANWLDQTKNIFFSVAVLVFHVIFAQLALVKISRPIAKLIATAGVLILLFALVNSILIINIWSPR